MSEHLIISHHASMAICDAAGINTRLKCRGNSKDRRRNKRLSSGRRSDFLARNFILSTIHKRIDDAILSALSYLCVEGTSHE